MIKKLTLLLFPALALLLAACSKEFPINFNPKHPKALVQINFTEHNLFPEGVVYDPIHNWFYVSSADHGTVGIVTFDGTYKPFITDEMLSNSNGLKVDKARQRLWVCDANKGIGAYNLNTGAFLFFADLAALVPDSSNNLINDEALDPEGNVYVTNSFVPVIYKVTREGKASIFFHKTAFANPSGGFGFNGIQYDERGFLLVAFANQIVKIPVRKPDDYSIVQLDAPVNPDGLLLSKDGKQLVAVDFTKVLSFISTDGWKSGHLSTSFEVGDVLPTTLTSDGKRVYVVYSYLDKWFAGQEQNTFTIQEVPLKKPTQF